MEKFCDTQQQHCQKGNGSHAFVVDGRHSDGGSSVGGVGGVGQDNDNGIAAVANDNGLIQQQARGEAAVVPQGAAANAPQPPLGRHCG